jgi:hypothetical protein
MLRRRWWLHLMLRRRWWLAWPLRRLSLLLVITLGGLCNHDHAIERRGMD